MSTPWNFKTRHVAASALLRELAGSIELSDGELDDDELEAAGDAGENGVLIGDADVDALLDDLLGDDSVGESDGGRKLARSRRQLEASLHEVDDAVAARLRALPPDTCMVCFEAADELDGALRELPCGHALCDECMVGHVRVQVEDAVRTAHRVVSLVRVREREFELAHVWAPSVRCPGLGCSALILEPLVAKLVDEPTLARFRSFSAMRIEQLAAEPKTVVDPDTVEDKDRPGYATTGRLLRSSDGRVRCPRCHHFAVVSAFGTAARSDRLRCSACLLALCARCEQPHTRMIGCAEFHKPSVPRSVEQMDDKFAKWAISHGGGVRLCPFCSAVIQKSGGCDHHYCRACGRHYQWSQSPKPSLSNIEKFVRKMFLAPVDPTKKKPEPYTKRPVAGYKGD